MAERHLLNPEADNYTIEEVEPARFSLASRGFPKAKTGNGAATTWDMSKHPHLLLTGYDEPKSRLVASMAGKNSRIETRLACAEKPEWDTTGFSRTAFGLQPALDLLAETEREAKMRMAENKHFYNVSRYAHRPEKHIPQTILLMLGETLIVWLWDTGAWGSVSPRGVEDGNSSERELAAGMHGHLSRLSSPRKALAAGVHLVMSSPWALTSPDDTDGLRATRYARSYLGGKRSHKWWDIISRI